MYLRFQFTQVIVLSSSILMTISTLTTSADRAFAQPQTDGRQRSTTTPDSEVQLLDEPEFIDPATLMDPRLAAPTTVEFRGVSMKELYRWLQIDQKLSVVVDATAMKDDGILSSELVTDTLRDEPLYLILDRLKSLGIGWHEEAGDLFLTTSTAANLKMTTVSYNVGELLDAGYDGDRIVEAIASTIGGSWVQNGDEDGAVVLLGDVIFVRQTQSIQREVQGLLAGLKKPTRRTLTLDPPQHTALREKLAMKISITLEEVPLSEAIREIAGAADADIRLHAAELKSAFVRERSPVSVLMTDQKLSLVLQSALSEFKLTWMIQDGVIWIVHDSTAKMATRTGIYDVRDLCRDESESEALKYALMEQTGSSWMDNDDGDGILMFVRPGIMVVRHTELMLDSVLKLLENYRKALRESKPRNKSGPDPKEVLTYYYRLPTEMAVDLQSQLSELIRPETWKSETRPDAQGTIRLLKSTSELRDAHGNSAVSSKSAAVRGAGHVLVVEHSVLMIRQMREVHQAINELLNKLTTGERPVDVNSGGMGGQMGGGGGGFGGGFFNIRRSE